MLHNASIDLNKVKNNIEQAIHSKLLILGQSSGHAELHATAAYSLYQLHDIISKELESRTQLTAAKSTKAKAEAH